MVIGRDPSGIRWGCLEPERERELELERERELELEPEPERELELELELDPERELERELDPEPDPERERELEPEGPTASAPRPWSRKREQPADLSEAGIGNRDSGIQKAVAGGVGQFLEGKPAPWPGIHHLFSSTEGGRARVNSRR